MFESAKSLVLHVNNMSLSQQPVLISPLVSLLLFYRNMRLFTVFEVIKVVEKKEL